MTRSADRSAPMMQVPAIAPAWAAPPRVGALFTTRAGGVSSGGWGAAGAAGGLNLGANCGDEPARVASNRERLVQAIGMPVAWLDQVHGARVVEVPGPGLVDEDSVAAAVKADAQVTWSSGIALGVLVADCLPVLLADRGGRAVGVAHAGWRGLAAGVLENTVALMRSRHRDADLVAWLGPCIGPAAFEVGDDVLAAFAGQNERAAAHFRPGVRPGKWWADLPALARQRLQDLGIDAVSASNACTFSEGERFWSYRRDGVCGRMAGVIWLRD